MTKMPRPSVPLLWSRLALPADPCGVRAQVGSSEKGWFGVVRRWMPTHGLLAHGEPAK